MSDPVNNPKHYQIFPDTQVWDIISRSLTDEELIGYCKGNILKYKLRAGDKGYAEKDLEKAKWYQKRLQARYTPERAIKKAFKEWDASAARSNKPTNFVDCGKYSTGDEAKQTLGFCNP